MHRTAILPALLGIAACAASQNSDAAPGPEITSRIIWEGGSTSQMHTDAATDSRVVPASMDSVWTVLPGVYERLGVPEAGADEAGTMYGNRSFRARRIEGNRLSAYLDCGMGVTASPNADQYEVTMLMVTSLAAVEDGTRLVTTINASAKPRSVAGNPVQCQSKGALEGRVAELVLLAIVGIQRN